MQTADKNTDEGAYAQQCIAALRVLFNRRDRLETRRSAEKTRWKNKLTEDTQSLNEEIQRTTPKSSKDRKARLDEIRSLFEERESDREAKKSALNILKKQIAGVDKAIAEVVWSKPDQQTILDFSEDDEGLGLSRDIAIQIRAGIEDMVDDKGKISPDMAELRDRLENMGVTAADAAGLAVVIDEDEDEDEEGDDDEDED